MSGAKFKFIDKLDDMIQDAVDDGSLNASDNIRDQIDYLASEQAYDITANIMDKFNLNENEHFGEGDEVHDEIFQEVMDKIYNELGIY